MTRVFSGLADVSAPDPAPQSPLASWYTPGLSDGLGDRLLLFDNTTASPLELLRFKPEFSNAPGFEAALRERVEELAEFDHPALAKVRAVKWLSEGDGLTLVSNQVVGRRLSEILGQVQGTGLAVELIRQLSPALAALHERGIAHGILTPERIVITPDGRAMLCEHVLASAIDVLKLPTGWMRTHLGLAVPSGNGRIDLDGRSDIVQLGFIALSLAIGQRLDAAAYPEKVGLLIGDGAAAGAWPPGLRRWLERSLHLVWPPFASALEATAALDELPEHREPAHSTTPPAAHVEPLRLHEHRHEPGSNVIAIRANSHRSARAETPKPPAITPPVVPVETPPTPFFPDEAELPPAPPAPIKPIVTVERQPERVAATQPDAALKGRATDDARKAEPADVKIRATRQVETPVEVNIAFPDEARARGPKPHSRPAAVTAFSPEMLRAAFGEESVQAPPAVRRSILTARWFVAAVLAVAVLEAVIIAGLLFSRATPAATDVAATQSAPTAPAPNAGTTSDPVATGRRGNTPNRSSTTTAAAADTNAAARPEPAVERTGTLRFSSPIALEIYTNGTRIGTTASPILLPAGRHTLELVSEPLGYRATQNVTVAAGRTVSRAITLPHGRLNINALPWATVSVDGKPVGDTPLANLPVTIGPHEVTFRHPMLGEKRETTLVKAEGVTRVSVNMQR
jgi:hypothetical protein